MNKQHKENIFLRCLNIIFYGLNNITNSKIIKQNNFIENNDYIKFIDWLKQKNIIYDINKNGIINIYSNKPILISEDDHIDKIPGKVVFNSSLYIENNRFLKSIDECVKIMGNFEIKNVPNLCQIGDYLYVMCSFIIRRGDINLEILPNNLFAHTCLIDAENLKNFGNNTTIKGDCFIIKSSIREFSKNFKANSFFCGNGIRYKKFYNIKKNRQMIFRIIPTIIAPTRNQKIHTPMYTPIDIIVPTRSIYDTNISNDLDKANQLNYNDYIYKSGLIIKNSYMLLLNKIFSDDFKAISKREINKFIKNKNFMKYHNKIKTSVWDYCCTKEAIDFLSQNGYCFCEDEIKTIDSPFIKNMYEKELINKKIINKSYKQLESNSIVNRNKITKTYNVI